MRKYPEAMEQAITKDNLAGLTRAEAADKLSRMFNVSISEKQLKDFMHRLHISQGDVGMKPKQGNRKIYPEGYVDYIKSLQPGMHWEECYEKVMDHFGLDRNYIGLQCFLGYVKQKDIKNGISCKFDHHHPGNKGKKMSPEQYEKCKATMFKKGDRPGNELPVGSVVRAADGRWKKKVAEDRVPYRRNWEYIHRLIWIEANGPIPEGYKVTFLDGNYDNLTLENLALVSSAELQYMNRKGLKTESPEITKTGIAIARLYQTMKEKEGNTNG